MNGNEVLTRNIDKIHTTEMGIDRIKRNLGLADFDVVEYCKALTSGVKTGTVKSGMCG